VQMLDGLVGQQTIIYSLYLWDLQVQTFTYAVGSQRTKFCIPINNTLGLTGLAPNGATHCGTPKNSTSAAVLNCDHVRCFIFSIRRQLGETSNNYWLGLLREKIGAGCATFQ
jgi:hypothetical protein